MRFRRAILPAAAAVAALFALPSHAQERHEGYEHRGEGERHVEYHGRIERFHEHDWGVWRGGHWSREMHEGRYGWWWVVGGLWYFYPSPVYPWPDPYVPPVVTLPPPQVQPASPPPPPQPQVWYFCTSTNSYYPYTPSCPEGWRTVPATPQR